MNIEWMKGTNAPRRGQNQYGKSVLEPRVEIAHNSSDQVGREKQSPATLVNKTPVDNTTLGEKIETNQHKKKKKKKKERIDKN
jgi:hypothetical protein